MGRSPLEIASKLYCGTCGLVGPSHDLRIDIGMIYGVGFHLGDLTFDLLKLIWRGHHLLEGFHSRFIGMFYLGDPCVHPERTWESFFAHSMEIRYDLPS